MGIEAINLANLRSEGFDVHASSAVPIWHRTRRLRLQASHVVHDINSGDTFISMYIMPSKAQHPTLHTLS